ncbi:MAG: cation diffusion facilitator family transporter [Planctomycetota bacterium]
MHRRAAPATGPLADRRRALARPLAVTVAVHAVLAVLLFGAAWITGSAGITASAVHVSIGSAAHLFALAGIWLSTRPPDESRPYGYERYEALSALVIGMLLLGAVALIAVVAVPRLLEPRQIEQTGAGAALMIGSAAANTGLFVFLRAEGEGLSSQILRSEAVHASADALAALAVLLGLGASALGLLHLDPLVALALGGLVAWRAWSVIRGAAAVLTDVAPVDIEQVRLAATAVPGVFDCHAVRSRGDAGHARVDLHIHVDPALTVREAHAIARAVEAKLIEQVGGVVEVLVHIGGAPP